MLSIRKKGRDRPMMGKARSPSESPPRESTTSHAVMVVPTFVPNKTPTLSRTVIIPALTKLINVTVTAELDCKIIVIKLPVSAPMPVLSVNLPKNLRKGLPETLRIASLMTRMPKRKMPRPPKIFRMKNNADMKGRIYKKGASNGC